MRSSVALNQVVILFIYLYTSSGTLEKVEYGPSQIWNGSLHVLIVEYVIHTTALWPEKNCQMSIKLPKNGFTGKIKDFNTFTKIA